MNEKPIEISRATYKQIKSMNRDQLSDFVTEIYASGVRDSVIDYDELRKIIGSAPGIGEVRLNQIMEKIEEHYK